MQIKYIVDETGINFEHPPNKVMGFNPVILDAMSEKMVRSSYKTNLKNIDIFFNSGTKEGNEKLRTICQTSISIFGLQEIWMLHVSIHCNRFKYY